MDLRINVDLTVEEYRELLNKSAKEKYEYFLSLGYFSNECRVLVDHAFSLDVKFFQTLEYIRDEDEDNDDYYCDEEAVDALHRLSMDISNRLRC